MEQEIPEAHEGVIVDEVAGQYAGAEALAYAKGLGFQGNGSALDTFLLEKAEAAAAAWDWSAGPAWPDDHYLAFDSLNDLLLDAEDWLNERAPRGFYFEWREGNFLLTREEA